MNTDEILLHRNPKLLERLLPFLLHLLSSLQLLLPGLVQALHKFLARLHLFLELSLGHSFDSAIFRLIRDFLLFWGNSRIERCLRTCSSNTSYASRYRMMIAINPTRGVIRYKLKGTKEEIEISQHHIRQQPQRHSTSINLLVLVRLNRTDL